jgi:hypothetical protein
MGRTQVTEPEPIPGVRVVTALIGEAAPIILQPIDRVVGPPQSPQSQSEAYSRTAWCHGSAWVLTGGAPPLVLLPTFHLSRITARDVPRSESE